VRGTPELKIAGIAPIPRNKVKNAIRVKPGVFRQYDNAESKSPKICHTPHALTRPKTPNIDVQAMAGFCKT